MLLHWKCLTYMFCVLFQTCFVFQYFFATPLCLVLLTSSVSYMWARLFISKEYRKTPFCSHYTGQHVPYSMKYNVLRASKHGVQYLSPVLWIDSLSWRLILSDSSSQWCLASHRCLRLENLPWAIQRKFIVWNWNVFHFATVTVPTDTWWNFGTMWVTYKQKRSFLVFR